MCNVVDIMMSLQTVSHMERLLKASRQGDGEKLKEIIRDGVDVNQQNEEKGWAALHVAAMNGHAEVVKILICAGADVEVQEREDGWSPLFYASRSGHSEVVKMLLSAAADVDHQAGDGRSPLWTASGNGHAEVVKLLVQSQSDVDLQDEDGRSPLHIACMNGHVEVVKTLVSAKADLDIQQNTGESPLHSASFAGHFAIIQVLVSADADVNLQDKNGRTPLFCATVCSRTSAVQILLANGADATIKPHSAPFTALQVACFTGCFNLVKVFLLHLAEQGFVYNDSLLALCASAAAHCIARLRTCEEDAEGRQLEATQMEVNEAQLSIELHEQLNKAGFNCRMASLQSAAADVMQQIERKRVNKDDIFFVGSFSESWGNSLSSLIGKTDLDSDIDVTQFINGRLYHLRGWCTCLNANNEDIFDYKNGHVIVSGSANNPALHVDGSLLRPAFDRVSAYRCCCYPHIELLDTPGRHSHLSKSLLEALAQTVRESGCHLVTAAPPGQAGQQLRVSTTFLEKLVMRSLTDVQGQLFILLKYLIKKEISEKVKGLKTYHAKCLLFYMLDETPAAVWSSEKLVSLTRKSLQKLLDSVQTSETGSSECMRHFFLRDACVYLKSGHSDKQDIAKAVTCVKENLAHYLTLFQNVQLKPLRSQMRNFYFHPFLNIPYMFDWKTPSSHTLEYHEIWDFVRDFILLMSRPDSTQQSLTACINRIPEFARTARETLRAIALLKFDKHEDAISVLRQLGGHSVSKGIVTDSQADGRSNEDVVWQHLKCSDSAWKFCFYISKRPRLKFLPKFISNIFLTVISNYGTYFFINFDAVKKCMMLELIGTDISEANAWFEELVHSDDADVQELAMALHYCRNINVLKNIIHDHKSVILDNEVTRNEFLQLMIELPELQEVSAMKTLMNLKIQLIDSEARELDGED